MLARITPTADYGALAGCDLVIEAVFEDRKVKAETIAKAQAVIGPDAIFASNTSTLPITSLAAEFKDPARFIGIHFFSPVERMMLVEIILGKKTGDEALAAALDFVRAIRKTPIVVNDSRGFYANRCVLNYHPRRPPDAGRGRAAGDDRERRAHGRHAGRPAVAQRRGGARSRPGRSSRRPKPISGRRRSIRGRRRCSRRWSRSAAGSAARTARASTTIRRAGPKRLWPGLAELQPTSSIPTPSTSQELKHRLLVVQALEAARSVEEGVITDVREADVGSILGFGFAPFSGGTLSYIDMMGDEAFVELCERLEQKYGDRFQAAQAAARHGRQGRHLLRRFAPGTKAA